MAVQISEPLLERNKVNGHDIEIRTGDFENLEYTIKNPYRPVTPWNLVSFMFMLHKRKGLEPPRPMRSYLRQAKRLIDIVGPDEAEKLMLKASGLSKYAWGFPFVERLRRV